jgi:VanZ family protein
VDARPTHVSLWAPVALYMLMIFGFSSVSNPPALPGSDKNLHALLYAGLGLLLTRALSKGFDSPVRLGTAVLATVLAAMYGVSDEFHQHFVPPRQVEALDVVADAIGAGAAAFGLYAWGIIHFRDGV